MSERRQLKSERSSALEIAKKWSKIPSEHLEIALKALEPELQREHQRRLAEQRQIERDAQRKHVRYLCGLWAGLSLAVVMLTVGVILAIYGLLWPALLCTGPSLVAMAKIFVLRRSDPEDIRAVGQMQHESLTTTQTEG